MRFSGKTVVVTGGTRGIGKAIAKAFVKEGAEVAILGMNREAVERSAQEIGAIFYQVDVSKKEDVDAFAAKMAKVDILVNNAGVTRDQLLMKMTDEEWDAVLDTNLKSVFLMTKAFVRGMMKQRLGRIVNITSIVGLKGNPGQANYAASKAGMIGFTKTLAKEIATRNVTVNCVAPGGTATEMLDKLNEGQKEMLLKDVPMGRFGTAEEIASAVLFFSSEEAGYITGQVLAVDGGMTA